MKVAFFAEILIKDFDGASRTMFQLIERIPLSGFEFIFICGMHQEGFETQYQVLKVPTLQVPGNATYRFAVPFLKQKQITEELERFSPDVVHIATPSFLGNFGLNFAKKSNIPVISIYHTHFISYMDYYLKRVPFLINPAKGIIARSYRKFYNHCNVIFIPSESIAQELTTIGVQKKAQKIWKRGIDLRLFNSEKRDLHFIENITGNRKKNILFSSRLVWEKNLSVIIKLYKLLKQKGMPFNLIIAGSGVAEEECRKQMPEAYFLGHVGHEDLSILYASSDVFIFPSVTETFGNVVLEAMASGLPCVIADGGGSKDFIKNTENGFLCKPYNTEEYLQCIEEILSNQKLGEKLSKNGISYSQQFDWDYLADVYFQHLKSLA